MQHLNMGSRTLPESDNPPSSANNTWVTVQVAPNNTEADFLDLKALATSSAANHICLGSIDAS